MTTVRLSNRFRSSGSSARLGMLDPPDTGMHGVWWPRTRQLSSELVDLNEVLVGTHGLMHRITYAASDWDDTENGSCRATRAGSFVRLASSTTMPTNTLLIDTLRNTNIRLLVLPPAFDEVQARWALRLMQRTNGRCSADQILRWCGV